MASKNISQKQFYFLGKRGESKKRSLKRGVTKKKDISGVYSPRLPVLTEIKIYI